MRRHFTKPLDIDRQSWRLGLVVSFEPGDFRIDFDALGFFDRAQFGGRGFQSLFPTGIVPKFLEEKKAVCTMRICPFCWLCRDAVAIVGKQLLVLSCSKDANSSCLPTYSASVPAQCTLQGGHVESGGCQHIACLLAA